MTLNNKSNLLISRNISKKSFKIIYSIVRAVLLIAVGYIILFPLFTMVSTALKTQSQLTDPSVVWIPKIVTFDNFEYAIGVLDYTNSFVRTLLINVVSAVIEIATCAITAYGFARFKFKGQKLFYAILVSTIIVPIQLTAVSSYISFSKFDIVGVFDLVGMLVGTDIRPNLIDTPLTFYLPSILSVGIKSGLIIFIYIQFFKGLPKELEEASSIDGCGSLGTFLRIVIPSSGVAILTVTIFSIIWHWNDYYLSVLYFSNNANLTVKLSQIATTLETFGISNQNAATNGIIMAGCLLYILPMLIMYLFLQKYFIQSIDRVGIVG